MKSFSRSLSLAVAAVCLSAACALAQEGTAAPPQPQPQPQPQVAQWTDNFDGAQLDAGKWERFSFQGTSGGKLKVEAGELRMRGMNGSRSGVRSKQSFTGDRFIFEATIAKVEMTLPAPDQKDTAPGTAVLAIMFDGSGRNRVEWLWTSEKTLEAWAVVDGAGERLDNRKLGTKLKNPTLGIVRRGDEFLFMLNGQEGLSKTIKNMPRSFRVMLYGWSSAENHWDSARVVTAK
jgi:opacity protein-like surface antigen